MLRETIEKGLCAAFLAAAIALFSAGCEQKPVAVVNGDEITEDMVQRMLRLRVEEHKERGADVAPSNLRSVVLDQLIAERLLIQGARENNIDVTEDVLEKEVASVRAGRGGGSSGGGLTDKELREKTRERMLIDRFIDSLVPTDSVTEDDMKAFYRESPTPFLKPEEINLRFIQVETEEAAKAVVGEIKKEKGDFDKVADKADKEKSAVVSGYGWTSPDVFGGEIASAMRNTDVGKFSGPHKGAEGYFIIRLKERKPQGVKSYEEARDEVRALMLSQKRQMAIIHWVAEKKRSSDIVRN